jgi:uncharacterized membrane protein
MPNIITHKRSSTSGVVPAATGLSQGELAINIADGKLYTKNNNNSIINLGVTSISGTIITPASGYLQTIAFNNTGDPDLSVRQLAWNNSEGTLALALSDTYEMFLGGELHYRVRNNTGSTILAGTAVYATGLTPGGNNRIEVAPKVADGSIREVRFMGLMTEDCNTGVNGFTTHFGYIRHIDTRGDASANGTTNKLWASGEPSWSEGDILYVHPTVAGKLTKIEPKHSISVAIILNRHQNQGKLFVRPNSYGHLNDNHDVSVSGATNGQFLQYNSSTDYWVPSSSGNFTSLSVNGTGVSISGHTHTVSDITNFNSSVSGLLPVGTANYLSKFGTGGSGLGNSLIFDNGTGVGIGTTTPSGALHVAGLLQGNSIGTTGIIVSNSHASQSANGQDHTSLYINPTFLTSSSNLNNTYGLLISPSSSGQYNTTNSYGLYVNASTLVSGTMNNNYSAAFMGGNVGVGTAAPSARLEVAASGTTSLDVAHFSNSNGVEKAKISLSSAGDGTFSIIDASNNTDIFLTSNASTASYINAGNVGIGTASPSYKLDVAGDAEFGSNNWLKLIDTGSNNGRLVFSNVGSIDSATFLFRNNAGSTEHMRITTGGDVGIGTSSPSGKLHVVGTGLFTSIDINNSVITGQGALTVNGGIVTQGSFVRSSIFGIYGDNNTRIYKADGSTLNYSVSSSGYKHSLGYDVTGNHTSWMVVNNTGVGIGTQAPTSKLHVAGDILATGSFIGGSGTALLPSFEFINDPDTGLFSPAANTIALATSGVERLRINNLGNVGIGTTSPSGKLHVVGTEKVFSVFGNDLTYGGQYPTTTLKGYTWFGKSDGSVGISAHHSNMGTFSSAADFYLFEGFNESVTAYTPICLAAGYDAQLFLNTDLNVGIGTATPYSKLQVNGSLSIAADGQDVSGGGEGIIFGTDGSISSNDNGPGPIFSVDLNNGLRTYGNGGAGNAVILSTDRSNLRVGIGTDTPDSTLHVVGDVNIDGNLTFDSFTESVVSNGNSGTSKTLSLTSGTVHTCTLTGNCTFTMPTATAGKSFSMFLNSGSGNYTASFSGVRWADSAIPTATITASKVDIYSFISDGTYWYGSFSQNYG